MKVEFCELSSREPRLEVFSTPIKRKNVKKTKESRPKNGLHVRKFGRVCEIVFNFTSNKTGHQQGFISFTESEILQLAHLCRRGRTDEAFLRAIEVAGIPKSKRRPATPGRKGEAQL